MQLTLDVPEDLAAQICPMQDRLPRILALGLREFEAEGLSGFYGVSEVLEFLAGLPTPQEILALHPSSLLRNEIERLLEKNRDAGLTPAEKERWRQIEYLEHLIRKAKIRAAQQIAALRLLQLNRLERVEERKLLRASGLGGD